MKKENFRRFLINTYRNPKTGRALGEKAVSDVLSRCLRVESTFHVDLDVVIAKGDLLALVRTLKGDHASARLRYRGENRYFYSVFVTALYKYAEFCKKPGLVDKYLSRKSLNLKGPQKRQ
jgi:hypothetical protein